MFEFLNYRYILTIGCGLVLSGCYLNSSITRLDPATQSTIATNQLSVVAIVSAASKNDSLTASGFRVRQTVGLIVGRQSYSTSGSYKVYSTVTGQLLSAELNE